MGNKMTTSGSATRAKWCRLCMSALNDPLDTASVSLFDEKDNNQHIVVDKLRQFVNLTVEPFDKLPQKVCQNCVVNLDFCIQFVDRCRRISHLVQNEAVELDYIEGKDHFWY